MPPLGPSIRGAGSRACCLALSYGQVTRLHKHARRRKKKIQPAQTRAKACKHARAWTHGWGGVETRPGVFTHLEPCLHTRVWLHGRVSTLGRFFADRARVLTARRANTGESMIL